MDYDYQDIAKKLDEVCSSHDLGGFFQMISPWMKPILTLRERLNMRDVNLKKCDLSLAEMEALSLDFFNEFDMGLKEKIERVLHDQTTIIHSAEPAEKGSKTAVGITTLANGTDVVEVDLHPENNIMGIVSIAHEFSHILSQRVQEKLKPNTDCVGEIESMFVEQIFIDWLVKKEVISEEDRSALRQTRENSLINDIGQIYDELRVVEKLGTPISAKRLQNWDTELAAKQDFGERGHFIRTIEHMITKPDETAEYKFRYVFGEIVARALYNDFLDNPKLTFERFQQFLAHSAEYNFGMRKIWQDGKCRTSKQLNMSQIEACLCSLLGKDFAQKISSALTLKKDESTAEI